MRLKPKRKYKNGDKRTKIKFLFFPLQIGEDRRWLEFVTILQVRNDCSNGAIENWEYQNWDNVEFID